MRGSLVELLIILSIISTLTLLWLNVLATISVKYDHELNSFQRNSQYIIIWLIPFFGASTVLFFVYQHSPDAIPKGWIPWPFKSLIFGTPIKSNKNRGSGSEYDSAGGSGNDGGGDGGGGGD